MINGGYEEGYSSCDYFWGKEPAKYVTDAVKLLKNLKNLKALDLGCGDGKNSNYLALNNFKVTAIDISSVAINNAKKNWNIHNISWVVTDIRTYVPEENKFDLVIATGSPHCLSKKEEISTLIAKMKKAVKIEGYIVLYSFNNRDNDFNGHSKNFIPTLLLHSWYLEEFSEFEVILSSDTLQSDMHPNNSIKHHHSITRILAKRIL